MPRPKAPNNAGKVLSHDYSEKAAAADNLAAQAVRNEENQAEGAKTLEETYITIKPGLRLPMSTFVDHDYVRRKAVDMFPNGATLVKEPLAGAEYGWPVKDDAHIAGRLRSKAYRLVSPDELREDCEASVTTCKMLGGEGVQLMNHVLVEIAPKFVKRLYKDREAAAALQLHGHLGFKTLQNNVSAVSNGVVSVEADVTTSEGTFSL
jgi:hypothetical protein